MTKDDLILSTVAYWLCQQRYHLLINSYKKISTVNVFHFHLTCIVSLHCLVKLRSHFIAKIPIPCPN